MKNEILISIIIPVYNVERYLHSCLNSLISKNMKSVEIILVDDGSSDSSGDICDKYDNKYDFVRVKHISNQGVSYARNLGLKMARGKWISWVDSDDTVCPGFIDIIKKLVQIEKIDVFKFGYQVLDLNTNFKMSQKSFNPKSLISETKEMAMYDLASVKYGNYLWCRLFKKKLFNNLEFPVGNNCEDTFLMIEILNNAQNFALYDELLYYHFSRPNSVTHNSDKTKLMLQSKDWFESNIRLTNKLKEYGFQKAYEKSESSILDIAYFLARDIDFRGYPDVGIYAKADEILNNYKKYINPTTSKKRIIQFFLRSKCRFFYDYIYRLSGKV